MTAREMTYAVLVGLGVIICNVKEDRYDGIQPARTRSDREPISVLC